MRIAVLSDIHGNLTAFEAVVEDLRQTSPDLILHGGDLADYGSSPVEVVDRIRDLGWPGVLRNTDQALAVPDALTNFAKESPHLERLLRMIEEIAEAIRGMLGPERLAWLSHLPLRQFHDSIALLHASPASLWRAPGLDDSDAELESVYSPLGSSLVVDGHIHRPFIRRLANMTVANSGSVSLSYDGDTRASYLLIDDGQPQTRRVPYDVQKEIVALLASGLPHADWLGTMLTHASFRMPSE